MEGKTIFKGPLDQKLRLASDMEFWTKVFHQLAEAEDAYTKRLQTIIDMVDGKLDQQDIPNVNDNNKDFNHAVSQVETFREHVVAVKSKATHTLETCRNAALELRRSSNDKLAETTRRIDALTMERLRKAFLKKEKSMKETKAAYHKAMATVEHTQILMLRLGYEKGTLDTELFKHEHRARDARVQYKHALRYAENQLDLLKSAASQCEADWVQMETSRVTKVARVTGEFLKLVCPTCSINEENLSGTINAGDMIRSMANRETVPMLEFEEYEMPILRLVMSKLKYEVTKNIENKVSAFDYDKTKVTYCHVIKPCSDKRRHFLSLKKGTYITQLIKPTSEGWAFGELKNRNGKTLKFGFYNVDCVEKAWSCC